jgi:phosphoribosylanthranilate isomerase
MIARTRIKICGLTRPEDAGLAADLGADALGFVFSPDSPRHVSPDAVRAITRRLPPFPIRVGVFVNVDPGEVARMADAAGVEVLQLHGDEDVASYAQLGWPLIKSVALHDDVAVSAAGRLAENVVPLVDATGGANRGGTGRTADWGLAARLAAKRRIVLAGGLTPENVADAVRQVRPWAVDVSSGVESAPGIKSADRLRAFFASVARITMEAERAGS